MFFFFKQKTAYEMRISDWSSDVCSSDLSARAFQPPFAHALAGKPASVMPRAMAETLVRSESKVTRTVEACASTADSVTPGPFPCAFSFVMLHAGPAMVAASRTTVSAAVAPAVPAHITAITANARPDEPTSELQQ